MTNKNTKDSVAVVKLSGGLGNQMFQYAFGRAYSLRHDIDVKYYAQDLIRENEHNGLELDRVFDLKLDLAQHHEILDIPVIKELPFRYHSEIAENKKAAYFCGWWNSEKYFNDYFDEIKKAFVWKKVNHLLPIAQTFRERNIGAVHFRRGDYIASPGKKQVFCSLGEYYYKRAIEHLYKEHQIKSFFIFSDDTISAIHFFNELKKKLPAEIEIQIYINESKEDSYLDMFLMSYCCAVITANSTFSWWACKLNVSKNIPIVMPNSWFTDTAITTKDLFFDRSVRF